jgi:hypothetical protein
MGTFTLMTNTTTVRRKTVPGHKTIWPVICVEIPNSKAKIYMLTSSPCLLQGSSLYWWPLLLAGKRYGERDRASPFIRAEPAWQPLRATHPHHQLPIILSICAELPPLVRPRATTIVADPHFFFLPRRSSPNTALSTPFTATLICCILPGRTATTRHERCHL